MLGLFLEVLTTKTKTPFFVSPDPAWGQRLSLEKWVAVSQTPLPTIKQTANRSCHGVLVSTTPSVLITVAAIAPAVNSRDWNSGLVSL